MKIFLCIITTLFFLSNVTAQSLDSYRVEKQWTLNSALHDLVINNNVQGMKSALAGSAANANVASTYVTNDGATGKIQNNIPLIFDVVYNCLDGVCSPEMLDVVLETGADMYVPYRAKTVIYVVLDYIVNMPIQCCENAEEVLGVLIKHKIKINNRFSNLPTPMAYLMRTTKKVHGGYNKDYVSEKVVLMMLKAGSKINSYDDDEGNLLDFALATESDNLASYLIRKGIDVRHNTKTGTNTLREAIAAGNLAIVKQMEEYDNAHIDINSLENNTREISRHPELYNYLAEICGFKAEVYEDLVLYRYRFPDKKSLVQDKYEALARKEVAAAVSFSDILKCENRYPDLQSITTPKKESIYRRDSRKLEQYLQDVLSSVNAITNFTDGMEICTLTDIATNYLKDYKVNHYDIDNKIYIAEELTQLEIVYAAVKMRMNTYFTMESHPIAYFLGLAPALESPSFDFGRYSQDKNTLECSISHIKNDSKCGFNGFYKKVANYLGDKLYRFHENANKQGESYNRAVEVYNRKVEEHRAMVAEANRRAEAEREAERQQKENDKIERQQRAHDSIVKLADSDKIFPPRKRMGDKWEHTNVIGAIVGGGIPGTWSVSVEYKDDNHTCGYIARSSETVDEDTEYYSVASGKRYKTMEDALAAEYYYKRYGIIRKTGKI